jgi:hypothetical protein
MSRGPRQEPPLDTFGARRASFVLLANSPGSAKCIRIEP